MDRSFPSILWNWGWPARFVCDRSPLLRNPPTGDGHRLRTQAAGSLQPRAACRQARTGLSILPQYGRDFLAGIDSADPSLHELPRDDSNPKRKAAPDPEE